MENEYYKRYEPFFGSWHIKRYIGAGSYGKVFEIERRDEFDTVLTGALKAITVPFSQDEMDEILADGMDQESASTYFRDYVKELNREIILMSKLKGHSNIVSYEDHVIKPHERDVGWDILIRMELLTPITTYLKASKSFSRREVIQLGIDMCRALEVCQRYDIIHRDIKPANIFISDTDDFKLGDFGVARIASSSTGASTRAGTVNYMAPEVFRGEKYTSNVDTYSLGLVMYQLLNDNRMPFYPPYPQSMSHLQREQGQAKRLSGQPLPPPAHADGRLAEIILKACAPDPANRYDSPAVMRQALEAIKITEGEAKIIYPEGDVVPVPPSVTGDKKEETQQDTMTEKVEDQPTERVPEPPVEPINPGNDDKTTFLFEEQEKKRRAEEEAKRRAAEEEARRKEEEREEQRRKTFEEAERQRQLVREEKRRAEEAARKRAEEEARRKEEEWKEQRRKTSEEAERQRQLVREEKRRAEEEARKAEQLRQQTQREKAAKAKKRLLVIGVAAVVIIAANLALNLGTSSVTKSRTASSSSSSRSSSVSGSSSVTPRAAYEASRSASSLSSASSEQNASTSRASSSSSSASSSSKAASSSSSSAAASSKAVSSSSSAASSSKAVSSSTAVSTSTETVSTVGYASASLGADGVITVTVDSQGQTLNVSVEMVYLADPSQVYSMGQIGTWTTGNYRFAPTRPGSSGEYSIRFRDQNGHLLTSINVTL